jgi:cell division protein FtsB
MPSATGENRRRVAKAEEPRFLRKRLTDQGRGAPIGVLRVLAWTIAVWFVSAILLSDSGLFSILRMRGMQGKLQDEIEALELARDEVAQYNEDLRNDPETVERVAREQYGMIRDGEICYRVVLEEDE